MLNYLFKSCEKHHLLTRDSMFLDTVSGGYKFPNSKHVFNSPCRCSHIQKRSFNKVDEIPHTPLT